MTFDTRGITDPGNDGRAQKGWLGISRWSILLVLMLAELTSVMEAAMTYAALPTFYRLYGDPIAIGWLYTAFLLVAGAAAGLCGALGDRLGRQRLLLFVLLGSTAGSVISMVAPTFGWIIAGRAIQGVSLAVLPLTLGLLRELLPDDEVPVAIGVLTIMATAAGAACFVLGGVMVDSLNWRWIFGVTAAVTAVATLFVIYCLPKSQMEPHAASGRVDWLGGTLYVPGVMLVLLAISQAAISGWTNPLILAALTAGAITLFGWAWWEWRHDAPLIDIRLMTTRHAALAFLSYALLGVGPFQFGLTVYTLLQQPGWTGAGYGFSATMAGVLNLPAALAGCFSGPWAGRIAARRGGRAALVISLLIYLAGWTIVAFIGGLTAMLLAIAVIGFGATMVFGSIANVLVEATPENRTSEVLGFAEVVRAIAMAIGSQIMAVILASSTVTRPNEGAYPSASAHDATLYLTVALCLGALLLAIAIPRQQSWVRSRTSPTGPPPNRP